MLIKRLTENALTRRCHVLLVMWMTANLLIPWAVKANEPQWDISLPWEQPAETPPDVKPFELPTLKGDAPHFITPAPALALKAAPKIDPDAIYTAVNNCYPEKTKFKIDVSLVAGVRSSVDQFNSSDWPAITDHYIGVVGEMPLYSTTEQAREREWEHKRRVNTAKNVATFAQALPCLPRNGVVFGDGSSFTSAGPTRDRQHGRASGIFRKSSCCPARYSEI